MERPKLKTPWYVPPVFGAVIALFVASELYGRDGYSLREIFSPPLLQRVGLMVLVTVVGACVLYYVLDRIQR